MPDMIPEASLALHRVNMSDSLVVPETVPLFLHSLTQFAQMQPERAEAMHVQAMNEVASAYGPSMSYRPDDKPFIFNGGVAVIPVRGMLLNRFNSCYSFATGYNFLRAQLNAVLADLKSEGGDVELVAFDVDSPGGEAVGCFELCQEIMAARERVSMISVVDALAASGGYAIASAPQRMVCTPSGSVGSIGVYRLHVDLSEALQKAGIKYTFFQAGDRKTDGNPYNPPSPEAAREMQASVEKRWEEFIAVVAEQRDMAPERVRDTQARVYRADEALDLGLIDAVNTPAQAVSDFLAELASDDPLDDGEEEMALPKNDTEFQAALAAARQEGVSSVTLPDINTAKAEAVAADRQRRKEIMGLPAAAKRPKLAASLADMDTTVEMATTILSAAAEEAPAAPTTEQQTATQQPGDAISTDPKAKPGETVSAFTARMNAEGSPNIAAQEHGGSEELSADEKKAQEILADQAKFGGVKLRTVQAA